MYTYKQVSELQVQGKSHLIPLAILEDDYSSMEYCYYYMTKRWYEEYVDETSDIVPDKENNKFILYLSDKAYKQMRYNSHSFPNQYESFKLEYRKKKKVS